MSNRSTPVSGSELEPGPHSSGRGTYAVCIPIANAEIAFPDRDLHWIVIGAGYAEEAGVAQRNGFIFYRDAKIAAVVLQYLKFGFTLIQIDDGNCSTGG